MKNAGQISMWRLRPVRGTSVIVCDFYDDAGRGAILWSFASPVRLSHENVRGWSGAEEPWENKYVVYQVFWVVCLGALQSG